MVRYSFTTLTTLLALASLTLSTPAPLTPDPSGNKNIGNGQGQQFITGACLSNADCQSACCAGPIGICSGPDASHQQGKTGCGFVSNSVSGSGSASAAAPAPPAASGASSSGSTGSGSGSAGSGTTGGGDAAQTEAASAPGASNVGKADGSQFITGACTSDADCASACCAKPAGVCSGPGAQFQNGKQGCGFTGPA